MLDLFCSLEFFICQSCPTQIREFQYHKCMNKMYVSILDISLPLILQLLVKSDWQTVDKSQIIIFNHNHMLPDLDKFREPSVTIIFHNQPSISYNKMKFKGHILKTSKEQVILKQQLGEGGFSTIYNTNKPQYICKVQVISQANIGFAYNNQKKSLRALSHSNIVKLHYTQQQKIGTSEFGFMVLQNCSKGTALSVLEQTPSNLAEKTILKIGLDVATALQHMHHNGIAHRDIKLENVLATQSGNYKLCDFGSSSTQIIKQIDKQNRAHVQQFIEKTTTPLYRCPQQLDLYSGFPIGLQVDVFALGVMLFMLCFKKQPFQTRLSSINKQYFMPNQHPYSQDLIRIIEECFTCDPRQRPTSSMVRQQISNLIQRKKAHIDFNYERELEQTLDEITRVNQKTFKKTTAAQSSLFDKIKMIYSQMTTETEGWIIGFISDSQQAPNLKFNRSIISKCWQKRYKVEKFYEMLWKYSEENKSKCLVTLKLLTLMHNFLRKGPVEGLIFDSQHSAINICSKIYNHWKMNQKPVNSEDIKRNAYVVLLIRLYCLIIIGKTKLCYENSDIFEGNYSIVPFLTSKEDHTILRIPLIEQMIDFLDSCSKFHQIVQKHSYLVDIQRTIILSIVDQQYCLVSTLTFILSTFKSAISYVNEDLDIERLKKKVQNLQNKYAIIYTKLHQLFKQTAKLASLFQHNQFDLPIKVINYIQDINIDNKKKNQIFKISQYLNYKQSICGLKIPLTYEEVVKNPMFLKDIQGKSTSKGYIQINQYKTKKEIQDNHKNFKDHSKQSQIQSKKSCGGSPKIDEALSKNYVSSTSQPKSVIDKKSESDFSSFTFDIKPSKEKSQQKQNDQQNKMKDKDIFKTMEFTHQNLNKDFLTSEPKKDQFADFMSIVDEKYQGDRKISMVKNTKNQILLQSPQKNAPLEKQENNIKKVQLINFFQDEQQNKVEENSKSPQVPSKNQQEILLQKKKQMISQIKQVNISEDNFRTDSSFIDLKGFIVQEVKKSAEQYVIQYSALKFKKKIGFGHSSEVFKGQWRGREVAIKKIKDGMGSQNSEKQFKRQIMTSVKIRHHPQLVTLIGVAQHEGYFYIISEYCFGATLFDILHETEVPLPWKTRVSMAKQIAKGMVFLHTNEPPIIHRDLKSLNVLLVNKYSDKHPQNMQIKIADFGLSRDFASTYMTGTLGTYHWMAPQIFNNQPYTLKADVYSFGIVLWQIAARKPPYLNMKNPQALMKFITIQNGRPDISQLKDCPLEYVQLIARCWDKSPEVRPSFQQILEILSRMAIIL